MTVLRRALLVVVGLLSVASGGAKVMLMPQELEFFGSIGLSHLGIILFGACQLGGAALLSFERTGLVGAVVLAATFVLSSAMIIMNGSPAFGLFSLFPVVLLGIIVYLRRAVTARHE